MKAAQIAAAGFVRGLDLAERDPYRLKAQFTDVENCAERSVE